MFKEGCVCLNLRVYLLAVSAFVVGTVELIVGGILDLIAADLHISVSAAGQFITIFSVAFAISAPILMNLTAKMERKKLYLYALAVFVLANLIVAFSSSYALTLSARALSAMSGSVIIVLSITMASKLVPESHRGRAIGVIYMGISGSLVLGVPIGMVIGNAYGWRAPFLLIVALSLVAMICIALFLQRTQPSPAVPLRQQLSTLRSSKIISGQLISFIMLTGHLTLYAYLAPFVQSNFDISPTMMSVVYFMFGIAAVSGGGLGGLLSDKWGVNKTILLIVTCFSGAMFMMLLASQASIYVFMAAMMIWGGLSWALSPAQQSYLIKHAPDTVEIQLSLNNSVMHLGIATGSFIGGIVIEKSSVANNPWVGGMIALLALGCAAFSISRKPVDANVPAAKRPSASTVGSIAEQA